jgi:hypothetical protein
MQRRTCLSILQIFGRLTICIFCVKSVACFLTRSMHAVRLALSGARFKYLHSMIKNNSTVNTINY